MGEKTVSRRYWVIPFVSLMIVASLISPSYGGEANQYQYGLSVFGGRGDTGHNKPRVQVYGLLPRIGVSLYREWHLEFEGNFSYWEIYGEKDFYFLGANTNILFKPIERKWGSLFVLAGGGLGYDSAGKRVIEIGDSHIGGIYQLGGGGFL